MTQEFLQNAVVDDLRQLFRDYHLTNSLGVRRAVNVYPQDTPIREGDDEGADPEAPPEPYIIVKAVSGSIQDERSPHAVKLVLVVCVYDRDPNRQGYRDALHIINEVMRHYITNRVVGRRYVVQYPMEWVLQEDDNHPYYLAAMSMNVEAQAVTMEEPET